MSRIQARELAFKIIFSLDDCNYFSENINVVLSDNGYNINKEEILSLFEENNLVLNEDQSFCVELVNLYIKNKEYIDSTIQKYVVNFKNKHICKTDLAILRLAVAEIKFVKSDFKLVINESVNLSKKYSEDNGYKFVHGVLANIVKE